MLIGMGNLVSHSMHRPCIMCICIYIYAAKSLSKNRKVEKTFGAMHYAIQTKIRIVSQGGKLFS